MNRTLASAFAAFDGAGVSWCLLRGEGDLERPHGDVDVLVDDADTVAALLAELGFVRLRAWGHGSHRFFVAYDEKDDLWVELDVVTELAFGPSQSIRTGAEAKALEHRVRSGDAALLDADDRFSALLLHCVLDRGDIPEQHATALRSLAGEATGTGAIARTAALYWPEGWNAARARAAVEAEEWDALLAAGRALGKRWARAMPAGAAWRRSARPAAQKLLRVQTALTARGLVVALLGPDGAGKSTLATGLEKTFFFPTRVFYLGLYSDKTAHDGPASLRRAARAAWLARTAAAMRVEQARGRLVLGDRHTYDALLADPHESRAARTRLRAVAAAAPEPDLVVLLDAPAELMFERKGEHDVATLERQRQRYLALRDRVPQLVVVDASVDAETLRRRVTALIWDRYAARKAAA